MHRNSTFDDYLDAVNKAPNKFTAEYISKLLNKREATVIPYLLRRKDDLNIESDGTQYKYRKIGENVIQPPIEQPIPVSSEDIINAFLKFSNEDKATLIATIFPIVTEQELVTKFNELYPDYILADVKAKDKLFHPILGEIEIEDATRDKLYFFGNGQSWECTRNGHVITNGKPSGRRILFLDINDYLGYMKQNKAV